MAHLGHSTHVDVSSVVCGSDLIAIARVECSRLPVPRGSRPLYMRTLCSPRVGRAHTKPHCGFRRADFIRFASSVCRRGREQASPKWDQLLGVAGDWVLLRSTQRTDGQDRGDRLPPASPLPAFLPQASQRPCSLPHPPQTHFFACVSPCSPCSFLHPLNRP